MFEKSAEVEPDVASDSLKIYIERMEKPNNFLNNDSEGEIKRRILVKNDLVHQTMLVHHRVMLEEGVEQQLKQQKEH